MTFKFFMVSGLDNFIFLMLFTAEVKCKCEPLYDADVLFTTVSTLFHISLLNRFYQNYFSFRV